MTAFWVPDEDTEDTGDSSPNKLASLCYHAASRARARAALATDQKTKDYWQKSEESWRRLFAVCVLLMQHAGKSPNHG